MGKNNRAGREEDEGQLKIDRRVWSNWLHLAVRPSSYFTGNAAAPRVELLSRFAIIVGDGPEALDPERRDPAAAHDRGRAVDDWLSPVHVSAVVRNVALNLLNEKRSSIAELSGTAMSRRIEAVKT